jgi:RNA methyltransferase, TrmH family
MRSITSLQNDTIKLVRSLEMRKVRRETGLFVAEGASVMITARQNGRLPKILILRAGAELTGEIARLVTAASGAGCDVIEATDAILEKVTTKDNPQAVVGVFEQIWQAPRGAS